MKKSTLFLLVFVQISLVLQLGAQIFPGKAHKETAESNIVALHNGVLIVPLFVQNKKIDTMKEMIESPQTDARSKEKLLTRLEKYLISQDSFNVAIVRHFRKSFDFSKVLFIEDHQIHGFDPANTIFINPDNFLPDPSIKMESKDYFFIKYYKTSGVASDPDSVRFLYLTNKDKTLLDRPFPNSPGRKKSFGMRFLDLLNLSPDKNDLLNTLVTKLNDNLTRYYKGKV